MSDSVPTALYAEAKAWIAQQQAYEAEFKRPAPLTAAQRKALEALRLPPPAAPNIGTANYVGMLLGRYHSSAIPRPCLLTKTPQSTAKSAPKAARLSLLSMVSILPGPAK